MQKTNEIVIKPKKPIAPPALSYLVSVIYIGFLFIGLLILLDKLDLFIGLGIIAIFIVFTVILSNAFDWWVSETFYTKGERLHCDYKDNISMMGNSITTYKFLDIEDVEKTGNGYKITGQIEVKEPLQKVKIKNTVRLYNLTDNVIVKLKEIHE